MSDHSDDSRSDSGVAEDAEDAASGSGSASRSASGPKFVEDDEAEGSGNEPTEDEIREYAEYIGIDPEKEPHLLWIAKEGVGAPVPKPWQMCQDGDEVFYYNHETKESIWDHPCDDKYRSLVEEHRGKSTAGAAPAGSSATGAEAAGSEEATATAAGDAAAPEADAKSLEAAAAAEAVEAPGPAPDAGAPAPSAADASSPTSEDLAKLWASHAGGRRSSKSSCSSRSPPGSPPRSRSPSPEPRPPASLPASAPSSGPASRSNSPGLQPAASPPRSAPGSPREEVPEAGNSSVPPEADGEAGPAAGAVEEDVNMKDSCLAVAPPRGLDGGIEAGIGSGGSSNGDEVSENLENWSAPATPLASELSDTAGAGRSLAAGQRSREEEAEVQSSAGVEPKSWSELSSQLQGLAAALRGIQEIRKKQAEYLQRLRGSPAAAINI